MKSLDNYLKGTSPKAENSVTVEYLRGGIVTIKQGGFPKNDIIYLNKEQVKDLHAKLSKLV